jgi:hypothetical protein
MEETFDFGEALKRLKAGKHVARVGWHGKGMWLAYQKAYPDGIPINQNTADATGMKLGTVCKFLPYLMMKTAPRDRLQEENCFVPWLASQTDLIEEDWTEVKTPA